MDFDVYAIVHPTDPSRREHIEVELDRVGIRERVIVPGTSPSALGNANAHVAITYAHMECFSRFVSSCSRKHLLVLEDDVSFTVSDPVGELHRALRAIAQLPWYSLHVGHLPLGPSVPINTQITWSVLPFCAHAILWNNRHVRELLNAGLARAGRPYLFEGNVQLPWYSRFAMLRPIATQSRRPKELVSIDSFPVLGHITRRFQFASWNDAFVCVSIITPVSILLFASVAFWKTALAQVLILPIAVVVFACLFDVLERIRRSNHPA